jgi:hypothetical protein
VRAEDRGSSPGAPSARRGWAPGLLLEPLLQDVFTGSPPFSTVKRSNGDVPNTGRSASS